MSRLIVNHLEKWREDILRDIEELTGVLDWLDEQIRLDGEPPKPPSAVPPPEAPSAPPPAAQEAPPEPTEAPAPEGEGPRERGPYVRTTPEQLRDLVMQHGPCSATEVARLTGASPSSVRPKLDEWVSKGTMVKEGMLVDGVRVHVYRIKDIDRNPLRAKRTPRTPLRVVPSGGVPKTGQRNPKLMKRRGKIKGVKGS